MRSLDVKPNISLSALVDKAAYILFEMRASLLKVLTTFHMMAQDTAITPPTNRDHSTDTYASPIRPETAFRTDYAR